MNCKFSIFKNMASGLQGLEPIGLLVTTQCGRLYQMQNHAALTILLGNIVPLPIWTMPL